MGLNSGHFQRREYPVALRATCGVTLFRSHDPVYYKIINNEDEKSEMDRRDKMWTAKKVNKRKWKSVCDFFSPSEIRILNPHLFHLCKI